MQEKSTEMGSTGLFSAVLVALSLSTVAVVVSARRCPLLHAPDSANKTGCYIVVLKDDTPPEKVTEILQRATAVAEGNKLYGFVEVISKAFTLKLSAYSVAMVSVSSVSHWHLFPQSLALLPCTLLLSLTHP